MDIYRARYYNDLNDLNFQRLLLRDVQKAARVWPTEYALRAKAARRYREKHERTAYDESVRL